MIIKVTVALVLVVLVPVVWFSINWQFQDVRLEAGNTARFPCSVKCYPLIKSNRYYHLHHCYHQHHHQPRHNHHHHHHQVTNLGPLVLIWKHGTRVLTAGVGAGTM